MSSGKKASKINKLVADGTKNYPSYLKLIYTGDSELSSEDETIPSRRACHKPCGNNRLIADSCRPNNTVDFTKHNKNVYHNNVTKDIVNNDNESRELKEEEKRNETGITTHGVTNNLITKNNNNNIKPNNNNNTKTINNIKENIYTKNAISPSDPFPMLGSWHMMHSDKLTLNNYHEEEEDEEDTKRELLQIQDEIVSLKHVLSTKMALADDLKRRLKMGTVNEFKSGFINFKQSNTFQKTNAAFKTLGGLASRTFSSLKGSKSFFKVNKPDEVSHIKQSLSMADMKLSQPSMKTSHSIHDVCVQ